MIGDKLFLFKKLDSTNNRCAKMTETGELNHGDIVMTDFQDTGRGQGVNSWESEKGKNLLFSVYLEPSLSPANQFLISQWMSLSIKHFLELYVPEIRIKWPNDLYFKDAKIGGILIENTIMGEHIDHSICGVGININQSAFVSNAPNPISLKNITNNEYDLQLMMQVLSESMENLYQHINDEEEIRRRYKQSLYRLKEFHPFKTSETWLNARIVDVDSFGRIIMEDRDGLIQKYQFKEIEYVLK